MDSEQKSFQLILQSSYAKSLTFEALKIVKENKINEAKVKIEEAKIKLLEAKKLHAQMLRDMANNRAIEINLLLIHAQDQVMSSESCLLMVKEFIEIYERLGGKNE